MSGKNEMRWMRVLGFATIYFFIYIISLTIYFLYLIESHMTVYSYTLTWVLMHPELAIRIMFMELTRTPLSISIVILCSFILGFATDWVLRNLKRHILLRKREPRREFNHPKT